MDIEANLKKKVKTLQQDLNIAKQDQEAAIQKVTDLHREIGTVNRSLFSMKEGPRISDHALMRYVERKYDIDLDKIREEILSPKVTTAINAGANAINIDGGRFVIKDKTIITYIEGKGPVTK